MSWYRRANQKGGTYFFTVITYNRQPILPTDLGRSCLHQAVTVTRKNHPFKMEAICLLPDHLHCIWRLPEDNNVFSVRWASIKALFSKRYLKEGGKERSRSSSRQRSGEAAIWQRRFWEHLIRDQKDHARHMDYIHYNPVKHGLVQNVKDWPWSTFHRYVKDEIYESNWGSSGMEWTEKFDSAGE
jgi:putative transposase